MLIGPLVRIETRLSGHCTKVPAMKNRCTVVKSSARYPNLIAIGRFSVNSSSGDIHPPGLPEEHSQMSGCGTTTASSELPRLAVPVGYVDLRLTLSLLHMAVIVISAPGLVTGEMLLKLPLTNLKPICTLCVDAFSVDALGLDLWSSSVRLLEPLEGSPFYFLFELIE